MQNSGLFGVWWTYNFSLQPEDLGLNLVQTQMGIDWLFQNHIMRTLAFGVRWAQNISSKLAWCPMIFV